MFLDAHSVDMECLPGRYLGEVGSSGKLGGAICLGSGGEGSDKVDKSGEPRRLVNFA